ncbi:beta-hydroxyacyl-ACP dehydratase [Pontibacter sp. FD36]|uniref:beta-hydroxyacyl-ACP dehydratase n=1 Tax=Pontibacter sp. FD36 TaxID=2789860 RepID=UPI0018A8B57F|nr:beta-hydroxyacyl-ACP dehydratase [Pontibacter sp. FD36]MBF8964063.1 beta-hydroxyacyl-ACP dehydratase [Pontibacter sp. FD36]
MKDVLNLLPHREPFLFVDTILLSNEEKTIGTITFDKANLTLCTTFPNLDFVPATILIEAMAQCGGAGIKKFSAIQGLFGLATIESAVFHKVVPHGAEIEMVVRNLRVSERILKQSGVAYLDGEPAIEATWTCIRFQNGGN